MQIRLEQSKKRRADLPPQFLDRHPGRESKQGISKFFGGKTFERYITEQIDKRFSCSLFAHDAAKRPEPASRNRRGLDGER